jgi:hypothetical protein
MIVGITFNMSSSSGNGGGNGMVEGKGIVASIVDDIEEGKSAQDDHSALDQSDHADHADDLAVEYPIVEAAEHLVDSCESPFLRI